LGKAEASGDLLRGEAGDEKVENLRLSGGQSAPRAECRCDRLRVARREYDRDVDVLGLTVVPETTSHPPSGIRPRHIGIAAG
jgi:hypothetical protein